MLNEHIELPNEQSQQLQFEEFLHLLVLIAIENQIHTNNDNNDPPAHADPD